MRDILDRLNYAEVLVSPLLIQEAADTIAHLRQELERERRWIRQLENCVLDNINKEWGPIEQRTGCTKQGREG